VDIDGRVGVRGLHEAEHLAVRLVDPVLPVVDAVLVLDVQVRLVCPAELPVEFGASLTRAGAILFYA
jgi:hypothetical protein